MIVELLTPHTHAGREYAPGETLDVDEATARWLMERGVARAVPDTTTTSAPSSASSARKPTRKGD